MNTGTSLEPPAALWWGDGRGHGRAWVDSGDEGSALHLPDSLSPPGGSQAPGHSESFPLAAQGSWLLFSTQRLHVLLAANAARLFLRKNIEDQRVELVICIIE